MQRAIHVCNEARNLLLCALSPTEREHLLPYLKPVTFSLGQIVHEPGERIEYCYFPTTSAVSLLCPMQDGSTVEIGFVGKEGVLGIGAFLGGESDYTRAIVSLAGDAFRLPAKVLRSEFVHSAQLQTLLLRYTQALMAQISQTAVCNRLHSFEQRLCRWLLMCHDRKNRSELLMTQELMANMLGGRRESVTVAAGILQDAGLIRYCRGRVTILDRHGIESRVCECYDIVEDECERLLPTSRQTASHPGLEDFHKSLLSKPLT